MNNFSERLNKANTIAIIGCSTNKYRTSYHIASYLKENGYRVIPINPNYKEILGQKCYSVMNDISADTQIDIVDIFRDSQYTADMVRDIIDWGERSGQKPLIWTQLTVSSPEAKSLAEETGYDYVENECIMVQHSSKH
jgi:predicted CoA-binding protein